MYHRGNGSCRDPSGNPFFALQRPLTNKHQISFREQHCFAVAGRECLSERLEMAGNGPFGIWEGGWVASGGLRSLRAKGLLDQGCVVAQLWQCLQYGAWLSPCNQHVVHNASSHLELPLGKPFSTVCMCVRSHPHLLLPSPVVLLPSPVVLRGLLWSVSPGGPGMGLLLRVQGVGSLH